MKKVLLALVLIGLSAPLSTHAVVNSINGQTALDQSLVSPGSNATNTMHMDIVQVGTDTNRFRWDGTPWRIDQGGTGVQSLPAGLLVGNGASPLTAASILSPLTFTSNQLGCQMATSTQDGCLTAADWIRFDAATQGGGSPAGNNKEIQFNDSGSFGANSKFVFDPVTGYFGVGSAEPSSPLTFVDLMSETAVSPNIGARYSITNYNTGASPLPVLALRAARGTRANPSAILQNDFLGRIAFNGFDGTAFPAQGSISINAIAEENWTSAGQSAGLLIVTKSVGSTILTEKLRLTADGDFRVPRGDVSVGASNSGVTKVTIDSSDAGSCLVMKDSDGDGYTYITVNDGAMTASTDPCN